MRTALAYKSQHYPKDWNGRVPKRVRMLDTVSPDTPFRLANLGIVARSPKVYSGQVVDVTVNSHGAVSATTNDVKLGLKPAEFEVVDWWPESTGTREYPCTLWSLKDAKELAIAAEQKVWARIGGLPGIFEVYPGGRIIRREEPEGEQAP